MTALRRVRRWRIHGRQRTGRFCLQRRLHDNEFDRGNSVGLILRSERGSGRGGLLLGHILEFNDKQGRGKRGKRHQRDIHGHADRPHRRTDLCLSGIRPCQRHRHARSGAAVHLRFGHEVLQGRRVITPCDRFRMA